MERTYNIPLRKEYQKVPRWRRTKKAVTALKEFLVKHMKSTDVALGKELNEEIWKHGAKNPPHHVKVTATKDKDGKVKAELFGVKKVEEKKGKKAPKKEVKKEEELKVEAKVEEKPVEVKEAPKAEEKKE